MQFRGSVASAEAGAEARAAERSRSASKDILRDKSWITEGREEDRAHVIRKTFTPIAEQGRSIVDSVWFHSIVALLTVSNAIQMGLAVDHPDWGDAWHIADNVFTTGFLVEMVIKLCVLRMEYFHLWANWLDGTVSLLGILDCWILPLIGGMSDLDSRSLSVLRILRSLRLIRAARLIRMMKPLVLVLRGVVKAMSGAFYIFVVCICVIYVFAIFVTEYLGRPETDLYPGFSTDPEKIEEMEIMLNYNPYIFFGTMMKSMITLFNIASMTEWPEIVRPIAIKQPWFFPVLLFFVVFVGFGVLTVLVGVVVDVILIESKKIEQGYAKEIKKHKLQLFEDIQKVLSRNVEDNGSLDQEGLADVMRNSRLLRQIMADVDLPVGWTAGELLTMVDSGGNCRVNVEDFATGLFRLIDSDDFQQICILAGSINQVKRMMKAQDKMMMSLDGKVEANHSATQADLASIKAALGIPVDSQKNVREEQISAETQEPSSKTSRSMYSGKPGEWHSNIVSNDWVDSASDMYHKPEVSMLTSFWQIEEALRRALKVVSECIQEEFAATKPGLESKHPDSQSFPSVVEVVPCPSKLATVQMDIPDDRPSWGLKPYNDRQMDKEVGSVNDGNRLDSVNRNTDLTSGISSVARLSKGHDSGQVCTKQLAL